MNGRIILAEVEDKHKDLTPREIEIAKLVRMGKTIKQIAELLDISRRAVEFQRDNLRRKMGLKLKKRGLQSHLVTIC